MSPQFQITKALVLMSAVGLTACGGGGSDSSSPAPEQTSAPVTTTPTASASLEVANPIADMNAKVGEEFKFAIPENLCTAGDDADIDAQITQVKNSLGLSIINFERIEGQPNAAGEISVTVTCKTAEASVEDSFKIAVTEDNVAPTVDAGEPQNVTSGDTVTLTAKAEDSNTNDSIASYVWEQTGSGVAADTLTDSNSATATFTAPQVEQSETLTFTVTVTDSEGATASDTVEITVESQYVPDIAVTFPSAYGVVSSNEIDVFGTVETKNEATLATVTVLSGSTEYDAVVDADTGNWRAENVSVADISELTIVATDSKGLKKQLSHPVTADAAEAITINSELVDIGLNTQTNKLYIQSSGVLISDVATRILDMNTGELEVLEVQKAEGFESSTVKSFYLDTAGNRFFSSTGGEIMTTDLDTLEQTVVSSNETENGPVVGFAIDLLAAPDDQIYIVDNMNNQILTLNPDSGMRSLVVDTASSSMKNAPMSAILDKSANRLLVAFNFSSEVPFSAVDLTSKAISDVNGANADTVGDLAISKDGASLYYVKDSDLVRYDTTTETAEVIVEGLSQDATSVNADRLATGLELDETRGLLYVASMDKNTFGLMVTVVDLKTGDYIKL